METKKILLIGIFLVVLILPVFTSAAVYYVDASNGNDNNNGLSPETAWKTITRVNNEWGYQAGDDILFKRGETWTDSGLDIHHSGTTENPVIIGAYGAGPKPVIDGSRDFGGSAMSSIYSASYITIQDFRITNMVHGNYDGISFCCEPRSHITISRVDINNTNNCGIYLDQTDTYIIENCTVGYIGNAGIVIYGSAQNKTKNGIIRNCVSHDIASNDAFSLHKNGYGDDLGLNHLLENCVGYNSAEEAFDIGSGGNITLLNCESYGNDNGAISIGNNISNVVIERFYSHDENDDSIIVGPSSNVKLINSLIYNPAVSPLTLRDSTAFEGYHNTIIANSGSIDIGDNCHDITFKNNIVIHLSGEGRFMRYLFDSPTTTNSDFSHNIWWGPGIDSTTREWYDAEANKLFGFDYWVSHYNQGQGSMVTDPLLIDAQNGDGQLQANSPAIDAGTNVGVIQDFNTNPRPRGAGYDIGAYEYDNGTSPPPPACTENDWNYADGACQPNNTLTRTWTKIGACTGGTTHPPKETVPCTYNIPGDLNNDGMVDITDIIIVATNFGLTSGFDNRADTDNNNEVDIFDVVFVASRFT